MGEDLCQYSDTNLIQFLNHLRLYSVIPITHALDGIGKN
jgi:hypothetical protein